MISVPASVALFVAYYASAEIGCFLALGAYQDLGAEIPDGVLAYNRSIDYARRGQMTLRGQEPPPVTRPGTPPGQRAGVSSERR